MNYRGLKFLCAFVPFKQPAAGSGFLNRWVKAQKDINKYS
jgi:hypothetical protein